jgi:hypothetical protein
MYWKKKAFFINTKVAISSPAPFSDCGLPKLIYKLTPYYCNPRNGNKPRREEEARSVNAFAQKFVSLISWSMVLTC